MTPPPAMTGAIPLACLALLAACTDAASTDAPEPAAPEAIPEAVPEAVNGWREYPLRDGVVEIRHTPWRTDSIDIPVPPNGGDLEYKLQMSEGDGIVYTISYPGLVYADEMNVEFHGHTPQDETGVGDLMFYSVGEGATQSGTFIAPWTGIHGWYLKNESDEEIVVKLDVAGFYSLQNAPAE